MKKDISVQIYFKILLALILIPLIVWLENEKLLMFFTINKPIFKFRCINRYIFLLIG